VQLHLPAAGTLQLTLVQADGQAVPLYAGESAAREPLFWWQGDARRLRGARIDVRLTAGGDHETREWTHSVPVTGNPGLVAQILYPPPGAVVRQTVPIY